MAGQGFQIFRKAEGTELEIKFHTNSAEEVAAFLDALGRRFKEAGRKLNLSSRFGESVDGGLIPNFLTRRGKKPFDTPEASRPTPEKKPFDPPVPPEAPGPSVGIE